MNSQTLQSENFNTLSVGNIGTAINGATPGQAGWLTFSSNDGPTGSVTTSTNAGNTNYTVVQNGISASKGLNIEGGNGNYGSRFMWKDGLGASWGSRTSGNNIIEVEYSFFTGPTTTSRTQFGMRIYGTDNSVTPTATRVLNGLVYTTNTRVLTGLCYLNNAGVPGLFNITLQTGGLILNENTWYTIGCSYNTTTGETLWKTSPTGGNIGLVNTTWIPNLVPAEVDFVSSVIPPNATSTPPVPANTLASNIIFDNYISRASATNTLLENNNFVSNTTDFSVYPNPANDVVNISNSTSAIISNVEMTDLNGRVVKNVTLNATEGQINISDLSTGVYMMNVTSDQGSSIKKVVKN